jgi:hypothetical protein
MWPAFAFIFIAIGAVIGALVLTGAGAAPKAAFSLTTSPTTRSVQTGETVTYTVTVTGRGGFDDVVRLNAPDLAPGLTALMAPSSVHPTKRSATASATLTVHALATTARGNHQIHVRASGGQVQLASEVTLTVIDSLQNPPPGATTDHGARFTISGTPSGSLRPGATLPVDLLITNPNLSDLRVTSLSVAISGTGLSACGVSNFAITPYRGNYPLIVPAKQSRTLQSLGVTPAKYPHITLVNLTTNQDACKGATVTLSYSGTGSGD